MGKARSVEETLLIVGSIAFDSVETPRGSVDMALGGSASYASLAASYLARPQVVAIVGEDFGNEHLTRFEKNGVDTEGIERVRGKTFHWRGRYRDNFKERDTIETCLNVFEGFDPVLPEKYQQTCCVFLGNIDPTLQSAVLDQVSRSEIVAMDTMNFWINTQLKALKQVLRRVDILFINDEEAFQLSGAESVLLAAEEILALGPRYVVIKRGEYGSLLFGPEYRLFVPVVLLPRVVDPTGAGDAFAGGFMGYLSKVKALDRTSMAGALMRGTVMASFAVEAFSIDGLAELEEPAIDHRLKGLENLIDFR
ncbi:MAG: sugar kinase [Candidatus Latescibacteria bacterium]|nr:sugar kinase [Candidatus Latescibacterota bacterium]NIO01007.1 sugar kinase [Candidatus Latescibacterota bacterium]NIO27406.1 sugar kinase [Candidatus Latescibacterota bacterium]NIO54928.1 sugar kinase [Candidatus Latescibacterota bacterium]NIT01017.1 sugar kinase [Candidatus Latescibacterota bacterium]